jgi:hypothetical protein
MWIYCETFPDAVQRAKRHTVVAPICFFDFKITNIGNTIICGGRCPSDFKNCPQTSVTVFCWRLCSSQILRSEVTKGSWSKIKRLLLSCYLHGNMNVRMNIKWNGKASADVINVGFLPNSMGQSLCWAFNSRPVGQEISCFSGSLHSRIQCSSVSWASWLQSTPLHSAFKHLKRNDNYVYHLL